MSTDFCKSVITIPQTIGSCWFTALMMMIFYSQNSRKLLLYLDLPFKNNTSNLSKILKSLLYKNYKLDEKTIEFFNKNSIESILKKFNLNKKVRDFIFNKGYRIPFFISNLFQAIDIDYLSIDFFNTYRKNALTGEIKKRFYFGITETISLYEDRYNNQISKSDLTNDKKRQKYKINIKEKVEKSTPLYIVVNLWDTDEIVKKVFSNNYNSILQDFDIKNSYFSFNKSGLNNLSKEITFNYKTYVLDSIGLSNFNKVNGRAGHAIAGITCKNNKYVYNGWIRTTNDPTMATSINSNLPCELMPFEWDLHTEQEFCLNTNKCKLNIGNSFDKKQVCFSFNKGERTLIYILKDDNYRSIDYNYNSSISLSDDDNEEEREIEKEEKEREIKREIQEIINIIKELKKYENNIEQSIEKQHLELKNLLEKFNSYCKFIRKI